MSHPFYHQDNPPPKQFTLTATINNAPQIRVFVSVQDNTLQLSYHVEKCDWLQLPPCSTGRPERQDFLWENHCLECFFDLQDKDDKSYFEMNFSPAGAFNLYHFDDYRTPNTLPPIRANGFVLTHASKTDHQQGFDVYHISVKLEDIGQMKIGNINPAAILYRGNAPIFYAVHHATPPDFHDKAYWQTFA